MTVLPLADAARELEVSEGTVRRWLAAGAPAARRGGRGRGRRTLIDPEAVRAWRRQGDDARADLAQALASELPEMVASACVDAYRLAPDKRGAAFAAVATWQLVTGALVDRLRVEAPALSDPAVIPEAIERLRKIANK
jgi:hypothetical protein